MRTFVIMVEYSWRSDIYLNLWDFEFVHNIGPYGIANFNTLLLQFSLDFSQIFADKSPDIRRALAVTFLGDLPNIKTFMAF